MAPSSSRVIGQISRKASDIVFVTFKINLQIPRASNSAGDYTRRTFSPTFHVVILHTSCHSNIKSQLDKKNNNFIDNYNQLNMFRAIISPILRSTRLC